MRLFHVALPALLFTACTVQSGGGPLDNGKSDGESKCLTNLQLVAEAREALIASEPETYSLDSWSDEGGVIELGEDLDEDGLFDIIVLPGITDAANNQEMVVMLGDPETDCIDPQIVGHFKGSEVTVELAGPEGGGPKVLHVRRVDGCADVSTAYQLIDGRFVEVSSEIDSSACD